MRRQKPLHWRQRAGASFHHIVSGPAVNVHVNKAGRQYAVGKIHLRGCRRDFPAAPAMSLQR